MVIKILIIVIVVLIVIAGSLLYFWLSEIEMHERYVEHAVKRAAEYEEKINEFEKRVTDIEHRHVHIIEEQRRPIFTLAASAVVKRPFGYEISEEEKEAIIKSIIKKDISEQLLKAAEVIIEENPIDQSTTFCVRINTIPGDQPYEDYRRYSARES